MTGQVGMRSKSHTSSDSPRWHERKSANRRTATLIDDTTVPGVSEAMQAVAEDWMLERFFRLPPGQFHAVDEGTFRHVWYCFREVLVPFFARAAAESRGVVCTISH